MWDKLSMQLFPRNESLDYAASLTSAPFCRHAMIH
jgi:hypothetical protein